MTYKPIRKYLECNNLAYCKFCPKYVGCDIRERLKEVYISILANLKKGTKI